MIVRLDGPGAEAALAKLVSAAQYDRLRVTVTQATDTLEAYIEPLREREFYDALYDGIVPEGGL